MKLLEGIHTISNDDYHADPCPEPSLSKSIMQTLLFEVPIKAFLAHPKLNPNFIKEEDDKKFDIGTAAHSLLLEGVDNCEVIIADDWRKKETKQKRDDARAEGKTPLLEKEYDKTIVMVESGIRQIYECEELGITDLYKDGKAEQTFIWTETDDIGRKSWNRIKSDWVSNDYKLMFDYKATGLPADPNTYTKQIFNMGYDIQENYYKRGVKAVTGGIEPKFIFAVQETSEPYLMSFIGLSPMYQDIGKQKVEFGIYLWNQCRQSGIWSGYPQKICYVEPPGWAMASWEQRASDLEIGG